MTRVRALLFDMDGVIVDSNPVHRQAWEEYNLRQGLETTEEMHRFMYGKRNDEIVRGYYGDLLSESEVFAHGAAKEQLYRELANAQLRDALVPGLTKFLERHSDLPAAVATNAEPANVEFVLRGAGLERYFRAVVDGQQVPNPKPHPDVYLRAAELLGVAPEFCLVFEDSTGGVRAGLSAGMLVVGVATTHEHLPGTSLMIRDFDEPSLERWLEAQG